MDGPRLYDVRRTSILVLATSGMSSQQARQWADARQPDWIERVLLERDVWVFQSGELVVGWVSATSHEVDGLYTDPDYAGRGIGSRLLEFVEAELGARGCSEVCVEASRNAESWYMKRGYESTGPRPADGARPMRKQITPRVLN
jgi:putative acetyltransferase